MKRIVLDCPPGLPRPSTLIGAVIKGTSLEKHLKEPLFTFFGAWTYEFTDVDDTDWQEARKKIGPRIKKLYDRKIIRYGSY